MLDDGFVVIENGTFVGSDGGIYVPGATVEIKGGTFIGEYGAYFTGQNVKISGKAEFQGTVADIKVMGVVTFTSPVSGEPYSVIKYDGGVFVQGAEGVTMNHEWFTAAEDGYIIVQNNDNTLSYVKCAHNAVDGITCSVCGSELEASVTLNGVTTYYTTLLDATRAAANMTDPTIALLKDHPGTNSWLSGGKYTLDLNGFNVGTDTVWSLDLGGTTSDITLINTGKRVSIAGTVSSQGKLLIGKNIDVHRVYMTYGTLDISNADFESCILYCGVEGVNCNDFTLGHSYGIFDAYATENVSCTNQLIKGEGYCGSSLILKDRILLAMYFNNITPDMLAVVTFTDHKGVVHETLVEGDAFIKYNDNTYGVLVDELVTADGGQLVTVTVYDAQSNVVASASDSVDSYAARQMGESDLYEKIAKFTNSAYHYFH